MAETIEPKKISALTIIATLVLLGAFAGFTWLVFQQRQTIPTAASQKREERLKTLADLNAANQKILTTYHWVDKSKGIVGLPISRAMELVLNGLAANHPHPAGPINPPVPSPSPSPAASSGTGNQPSANPSPASAGQPPANAAPSASASPSPSPASSPLPASSPSTGSSPSPSPSPSPVSSQIQQVLSSHLSPLTSHRFPYVCA
jgi:hypothetical protein